MSEEDLWDKAAACVEAAHTTPDPKTRVVLTHLGNFWIRLIHEKPYGVDRHTATTIAEVAWIQAELIATQPTFH